SLKQEASSYRRWAIVTLLVLAAILIALLLMQGQLPGFTTSSNTSASPTPNLNAQTPGATDTNPTPPNLNTGANSSPVADPVVVPAATPTAVPKPALKLDTLVLSSADEK